MEVFAQTRAHAQLNEGGTRVQKARHRCSCCSCCGCCGMRVTRTAACLCGAQARAHTQHNNNNNNNNNNARTYARTHAACFIRVTAHTPREVVWPWGGIPKPLIPFSIFSSKQQRKRKTAAHSVPIELGPPLFQKFEPVPTPTLQTQIRP